MSLYPPGRGGLRKGAGRPRTSKRRTVSHHGRETIDAKHPVHVTSRISEGLPSLRHDAEHEVLVRCFLAMANHPGFALNEYSIQSNHIHMIVEVADAKALSSAMHSLNRRIASALNKLWNRRGSVFSDRYHAVAIKSPRQMRNVLRYVLNNAHHHGIYIDGPDPYSSAPWFTNWRHPEAKPPHPSPVTRPKTWLQSKGWTRHGLLLPGTLRA